MLNLHHPDCLPADPASHDLGILVLANEVFAMSMRADMPSDAVRHLAHIASELRDRAGDVRALMQECGL